MQHDEALPECRAYELVTPPYKEGNVPNPFAVAEDGSHVVISSYGAFDSPAGDPFNTTTEGAVYLLTRTLSGWKTTPTSAPESMFRSEVSFWDLNQDSAEHNSASAFTESLWSLIPKTRPPGDSSFYLRRPDGTFVEVGSPTPGETAENLTAYRYLGASGDLSHILFEVGLGSVYEYVGLGGARLSVGVIGGTGSTVPASACGARLGSGRELLSPLGSFYNAISANGSRIFFTAQRCGTQPPVEELLAREEIDGAGVTSTMTTPISEPSLTYCAESPASPCGDAEFEGASQDGSRVFFTSTQGLVAGASNDTESGDSAVSGCAETTPGLSGCNLYEYEYFPGDTHRLVLVSGDAAPQVQGVARISEDGSHVYFVAKGVLTSAKDALGETAQEGGENLYVYERDAGFPEGRMSFVTKLSSQDAVDWARADDRPVETSSDGRYLVFVSHGDLTGEPGIEADSAQIYRYDIQTEQLVRVSIGQSGYNNDGKTPGSAASLTVGPEAISGTLPMPYTARDSPAAAESTLTPDNGDVFFTSPAALAPGAMSNQADAFLTMALLSNVYEYKDGTVYLISAGQDTSVVHEQAATRLLGASATGDDVFFTTSNQLVPFDQDNQQDVYDARVEGGFAETGKSGCSGEACQGLVSVPPSLPTAGSVSEPTNAPGAFTVSVGSPKVKVKIKRTKTKTIKKRNSRAGRKSSRRKTQHGKTRKTDFSRAMRAGAKQR